MKWMIAALSNCIVLFPADAQQQPDSPAPPVSLQQPPANTAPPLVRIHNALEPPHSRFLALDQALNSSPDLSGNTGRLGAHNEAPTAMTTALGRYKAKVYRAVGTRWYECVDRQLSLLPVGTVHIQFTIYKDGSVTTKILKGNKSDLQLLLFISLDAIRKSAPFDPFSEGLRKEVGNSYTDDFTFNIDPHPNGLQNSL